LARESLAHMSPPHVKDETEAASEKLFSFNKTSQLYYNYNYQITF